MVIFVWGSTAVFLGPITYGLIFDHFKHSTEKEVLRFFAVKKQSTYLLSMMTLSYVMRPRFCRNIQTGVRRWIAINHFS